MTGRTKYGLLRSSRIEPIKHSSTDYGVKNPNILVAACIEAEVVKRASLPSSSYDRVLAADTHTHRHTNGNIIAVADVHNNWARMVRNHHRGVLQRRKTRAEPDGVGPDDLLAALAVLTKHSMVAVQAFFFANQSGCLRVVLGS